MQDGADPGAFPGFVGEFLRPLPRLPLSIFLTGMVRRLVHRRPGVLSRLGRDAATCLLIDPVDLPFQFRLLLAGPRSRVDVIDGNAPAGAAGAAARVRAPLLVLLGLLDGTYDADALFFSRDLVIEGDTEVVLAVRNAVEGADLTPAELVGLAGRLAAMFDRAAADALSLLRRRLAAPAPSILAERSKG